MASGGNQEEEEPMGGSRLFAGPPGRSPSTHITPWHLSQDKLENWYKEKKDTEEKANQEFAYSCELAIKDVLECFRKSTPDPAHHLGFDVDTAVKGGSFGKGTMVENLSDVDLVVCVNNPQLQPITETENLKKYKKTLGDIISHLKSKVVKLTDIQADLRSDKHSVNFKIKVRGRLVEFNLLPTTSQNVQHFRDTDRNKFLDMLDVDTGDVGREIREFYYASFVQHQVQFVREKPPYVQELIRLVKYWASKYLPEQFQKSYPLELITIDRWEKARKPNPLDKAKGLKSVLEVLANLDSLCVYWNYMLGVDVNLNETIIARLDMKRPIILDPANPTNNVGGLYQTDAGGSYRQDADGLYRQDAHGGLYLEHKEVIKINATSTLQTALLRDVRAWPIKERPQ